MNKNFAAESAVLAGLCQHGVELYYDIDYLQSDAFYEVNNQRLFKCLEKIFKDSSDVDLSSILSVAQDMGFYEEISSDDEVGNLRFLFNNGISKENARANASKIAKLMYSNRAMTVANVIERELGEISGDESIQDILNIIELPLLDFTSDIYNTSDNKPMRPADTIDEYLAEKEANPVDMLGLSTGWKNYDEAIGGGLRRKCVDLIGARMKVGKSFTGDGVCINVSSRDIPTLIVDSEMDREEHDNRMLAALSGVDIKKIETGKYIENEDETRRVREGVKKFKKMNYKFVNVSGMEFASILRIMRNFVYQDVGFDGSGRTNDCLIIYDYFKVTNPSEVTESKREHQLLAYQMMELHNFVVKHDIPMLSFVQLNRDGITSESTDAVAGSDGILRTCTSFTILKIKSEQEVSQDGPEKGNRKMVPIVARKGPGLEFGDYINYVYNFPNGSDIKELETRNFYLNNERGFDSNDTSRPDISNC